jgi:outer membrane protein OmpA-like peptidoglycan-associated protein
VIDVSSENDESSHEYGYHAEQALGPPNSIQSNDIRWMAWAPKERFGKEYIQVGFDHPKKVKQIAVVETFNPGSITRIILIDKQGKKHEVYENKRPSPTLIPTRIFRHKIRSADFYTKEVRIEMNTRDFGGITQIDAIAISDSHDNISTQINDIQYASELSSPQNLGYGINSEYAERLPIIAPYGKWLFYARKWDPNNMGSGKRPEDIKDDIYISEKLPRGDWGPGINPGPPINNKDHNFVVAVMADSREIILGNNYRTRNKDGISYARLTKRGWSDPEDFEIQGFYNRSQFSSYHVSDDGKILLISSEMEEGFGDRDLYVSFRTGRNTFSNPINLGPQVNTVGIENSVFLAADKKTIYFSSNGHPGYGGLDMYRTIRQDESWTKWSEPENLGKPLNSVGNEYSFTIPASGDYAYYASFMNSIGQSDIFRIKLPEEAQPDPVTLVTGKVYNAETQQDDSYAAVVVDGESLALTVEVEGFFAAAEALDENEELDYELSEIPVDEVEVEDPELEDLKRRLLEIQYEIKEVEQERNPEVKEEGKKEEEVVVAQVDEVDPELLEIQEKLRDKPESKPEKEENSEEVKQSKEEKPQQQEPEDPELDKLLRKLYGADEEIKEEKEEPVVTEEKPISETDSKPQSEAPKPKLEEAEAVTIEPEENIEDQAETEPFVEETPEQVDPELAKELEEELIRQLEEELRTVVKFELSEELKPEVRDQVEEDLRKELRKELEQKVREELKGELTSEALAEIESESTPIVQEQLKKDLRDDIVNQLRKEMREPVKRQLRRELEYQVKKDLEAQLRKELEAKIRQELEAKYAVETGEPVDEEPGYKEIEKDVFLIPIEEGQIIPLNNIFFDSNESTLKDESIAELERALAFLKKHGNLVVEIGGHTNGWCSHIFAHELSTERSKVVRQYFIDEGIHENRILYTGYGKTLPLASDDTLAGRRKNQRVEMKILKVE